MSDDRPELDASLTLLDDVPAMLWRAWPQGEGATTSGAGGNGQTGDGHARAGRDWCNRAWLEFRGRSLTDETGQGWLDDGVHPDDRERVGEAYVAGFARQEPFVLEYRAKRHDGTWCWIEEHVRPVRAADGSPAGFLGACQDMTARRAVVDRLEASQDATTLLLQTLFHDIASPLASTSAAAELLRDLPADQQAPLLDLVDAQLRRMQRVLDGVRDYDLASRGELVPRPTLVDLEVLVDEVITSATGGEAHNGRDVRVEVIAPQPVWLGAAMTERILENLIVNAISHTPVEARIEVDARVRGDTVELTVCDNGPGLDPELLTEIFAPYRQGGTGSGRFGLGLSLVQRYTQAHGGSVRARNVARGGACFEVSLPILQPSG